MNSELIISRLKNWGCDVEGALERVVNDKDLYVSLIADYKETFDFAGIKRLAQQNEVAKAFELAHNIKGAVGNLGLTPLFELDCFAVEILRKGSVEGVSEICDKLITEKAKLNEIFE